MKDVNIFEYMLSNPALEKAQTYLNEEQLALENISRNLPHDVDMNFCIIGGGLFNYLSLALQYFNKYILIEPNLSCFVDKEVLKDKKTINIECIEKKFENYCQNVPETTSKTKTLYVFWFNVISYIQNPIECLNRIVRPGDMVFISEWSGSEGAQKILQEYLSCVYGKESGNKTELSMSQALSLNELFYASNIKLIQQKVTNITIVDF